MKLKYYLRGLGIGIIVTALLMNVSFSKAESKETKVSVQENEQLSTYIKEEIQTESEEIKATDEGMTEQNIDVASSENESEDAMQDEQETVSETMISLTDEEDMDIAGLNDQQAAEDWGARTSNVTGGTTSYLLNIVRGDDSGTVSRKLQNAGIIDNASEFDAFLMQHGYDKRISVGIVEIPMGASWIEVAEKIAGE